MRIKIEVTAADIARGTPSSPSTCPISLATRRALPESLKNSKVTSVFTLDVETSDKHYKASFPVKADRFITAFDDCRPVKPFSFVAKFKNMNAPEGKSRAKNAKSKS